METVAAAEAGKNGSSTGFRWLLIVCFAFGAGNAQAGITNVQWIGPGGTGGNGAWSTAADWSGGVVPNDGNGNSYFVTLPSYYSNGGIASYGVTLDMSPTIDGLTVDSGAGLSAGSGTTMHVTGDINVNGGILAGGAIRADGTITNNGGWVLAEIDQAPIMSTNFVQNDGFLNIILGGTMDVNDAIVNEGQFIIAGGTLNGNLNVNGGALFAGCSSALPCIPIPAAINGSLTVANVAATSWTFGNGPLLVSDEASLAGLLVLDFHHSVAPYANGQTVPIMTYLAGSGKFNTFAWQGLQPWQTVTLDYGPNELDAVVHSPPPPPAVPEPPSFFLAISGFLVVIDRLRHVAG